MSNPAQRIEITNHVVIVDGQSIGDWIKRGSVAVRPLGVGMPTEVTVTLIADAVTVDLDIDQ